MACNVFSWKLSGTLSAVAASFEFHRESHLSHLLIQPRYVFLPMFAVPVVCQDNHWENSLRAVETDGSPVDAGVW